MQCFDEKNEPCIVINEDGSVYAYGGTFEKESN